MRSDITNARVKRSPNLLSMEEEGAWRLGHFVLTHAGWFLSLLVGVVYILSPELRAVGPQILGWLLSCLAYLGVLEVLSRTNDEFSETLLVRMLRVQLVTLLGSALFLLTGGTESYFWFVYLWPLFASALYLPRSVMWGICGEVVVLYFLASLAVAADLILINLTRLLTNLTVLLVLTIILRFLVESIKRYQAAERKLKYSEVLKQIQEDIDTAIDLDEVLNRILRRAVELVGVRDGSLMLMDEKGELRFRARFGRSLPEGEVEWTFKPGEGVAGWVVQSGRPYICHDVRTDAHFIPLPSKMTIRSLVSVPILSHGTVLGVINVDSTEPNRFSEADVELLVTLANQIAVTIERAELLDSLRQIGEKALNGAEDIYGHIVDTVHRLTRCPVAMWQVDETGKQAKIIAFRGIRSEHAQKAVVDLDRSVTGRAIREREIVQVLDIQADLNFQNRQEAARAGWQSMLAVPLLAGPERAVGTLSIYSTIKREEFTPWELDLLRTFAGQAGVVIHRNDLIKQLTVLMQQERTQRQQAETLREVLSAISPAIELEEVAERILDELGKVIEYSRASLQLIRGDARMLLAGRGFGEEAVDPWFLSPISQDRLVSRIVASKEPLILSEPSKDSDWGILPGTADVKSWVGLPLVYDQETIGFLTLDHEQPGFYTQAIKDLLISFANQAAIDIEKARLFEELTALYEGREMLSYVVIELIGATTYAELSSKALNIVSHVLNAEAALYIWRDAAEIFEFEDCVPEDFKSRLKATCPSGRVPLKPEMETQDHPFLLVDAHSRGGRLEGFVFVQRVGTLKQPAEPLSEFDRRNLLLLATAIGYALQQLGIDWPINHLPDRFDQKA